MARRRTGRFSTILALLIALGAALIVGGALAITRPLASQTVPAAPTANRQSAQAAIATVATPPPTATATVGSLISAQPPASAPMSATAITSPTPIPPIAASTARPRTPTPSPPAWTIIGRWQADQLIITEPFTTRGPWRLCWSQPDAQGSFQVMVGDPAQTAWELFSAPTGVTVGAFDFPQSGSYRLMFHSESRYTALVLARSGDLPSEPPPCG